MEFSSGKMENVRQKLILLLAGGLILFNLYALAWLPPDPYVYRGAFISVCIIIVNLIKPPKKTIAKILMGIFTLFALVGPIYAMVFADKLYSQYHYASLIEIYVFFIFIIGLFGVLTRVDAGVVFLVLLATSILYLLLGQYIPGLFGHNPLRLAFVASILYTDVTQGAFGSFSDIFTRIVSIFMVFAALLLASGLGDLFTAIACRIAGNATGGPAKVSIFSSGLFGMISGSPAANVLATGSFTIPTMKSVGYSPTMAASVEAIASTGGILVPPIMGASAFIMAELTGVPYLRICVVAIIPAFLWYFTCFFTVHFYALRVDVKKWQPPMAETIAVMKAKGHLILAIPALIGGLYFFASAEQGAFFGVIFLFFLTFVRKETRLNKAKIVSFVRTYANMFAGLLVFAIAIAIFIGAIVGTGVHLKLGSLLLSRIEQWY
ncbi:TRAP transporter large permease subunit, partial [Chloroflexota bacterium]